MRLFFLRELFHPVVICKDTDVKIIEVRLQIFGGADLLHIKPGLPAQAAVHARRRIPVPVGNLHIDTVRFPLRKNVAQNFIQNLLPCHTGGEIHQFLREGLSGGVAFGAEKPVFVLIDPHGVIGDRPDFRFSVAVGEGDIPLMEFAGALTGKGRICGAMINGVHEAFPCFRRNLFPVSFSEKGVELPMKAQRPGSQIVPDEKYRCCNQEQKGGGDEFSEGGQTTHGKIPFIFCGGRRMAAERICCNQYNLRRIHLQAHLSESPGRRISYFINGKRYVPFSSKLYNYTLECADRRKAVEKAFEQGEQRALRHGGKHDYI